MQRDHAPTTSQTDDRSLDSPAPTSASIDASIEQAGTNQDEIAQVLSSAQPSHRAVILTRLHTTFGNGFVQAVMTKLKDLGEHLKVGAGEAVGIAELAGFRYPVKSYEAQVDAGLFRGSRLDEAGMEALKTQGIRGVVNLCLENNDDAPHAAKAGINALHVPILDNTAPTIAQMNQFVDFARANPPTTAKPVRVVPAPRLLAIA